MKSQVPYYILLVLAVSLTGMVVFYNQSLRSDFAVMVGYTLPQAAAVEESVPEAMRYVEPPRQDMYVYDDYFPDEPVILVTFPLEINTATLDELVHIPKVGDTTAQRMIQYRDHLGGYTALEQLMEIQGIGEKTFEVIAPYLYIEGQWFPREERAEEMDGEE